MKKHLLLSSIIALSLPLTTPLSHANSGLFDPSIEDPNKEWSYYGKSTTIVGLPFVPKPVQVTFDGAIYTGQAELAFFTGSDLKPIHARQKHFKHGWMPIIQYEWTEEQITYALEIFSYEVPELGRDNLIQFAKLSARNVGNETMLATLAAGSRTSAVDFRKGSGSFVNPLTEFNMENQQLLRDGQLIYQFSDAAEMRVLKNVPYRGVYQAKDHQITDRTATGFSVFSRKLAPGESYSVEFKMPRVPVSDPSIIEAIRQADYQKMLGKTEEFWNTTFGKVRFSVPEKRVNDSFRGSMTHLLLATRGNSGKGHRQGSGLPYDALFINDYIDMMLAYERYGMSDIAMHNTEWLMKKQEPTGLFIDVHNRGNKELYTSHGQGLYSLVYPFLMDRDMDYAKKVYSSVQQAVGIIENDHYSDEHHGLVRPSIPYDAPMVFGYHTCHNLFSLTGLRAAIRMAEILGEKEDYQRWSKLEKGFRAAILKACDDAAERSGYITSGLYDWSDGWVQDRRTTEDPNNKHSNQDWENMLLIYPSELMKADNPLVHKTLDTIRKRKYREGIMTYRNGMHLHQYCTVNLAQQFIYSGRQVEALEDLYHILLHNGSTHEGFENLIDPWDDRTTRANCPPPHAWAAAKIAVMLRTMLVTEYGGNAGQNMAERGLKLYSLISPAWVKPGEHIAIENAPTEMGEVSSRMEFIKNGAELSFSNKFHTQPKYLSVQVPYFLDLVDFKTDAKESHVDGKIIYLSPDATKLSIKWKDVPKAHANNLQRILTRYRSEFDLSGDNFVTHKDSFAPENTPKPFLLDDEKDYPATPLSFELVKTAFLKEYGRRFKLAQAEGKKPFIIQAPPLLNDTERRNNYISTLPEHTDNLAFAKPVVVSSGMNAKWITDGHSHDPNKHWGATRGAWAQVDLETPQSVAKILVVPYFKDGRSHQFTVEFSLEGGNWEQIADFSKNKTPATKDGYTIEIEPTKMQYIRVNMISNSKNSGSTLVEVMAYPSED